MQHVQQCCGGLLQTAWLGRSRRDLLHTIVCRPWSSWRTLITPVYARRTTQKGRSNTGGFCSALVTTSEHRWLRSWWGQMLSWTWYSQTRNGQGCEGWEQPWLQWPWDSGLRILKGKNKTKNRITTVDFGRDFGLFRDPLGRTLWNMVLERKEVQESWLIFKNHLLQVQEWSFLTCRKSSKGVRRPVWLNKELLTS